jgi:hypothetical protein
LDQPYQQAWSISAPKDRRCGPGRAYLYALFLVFVLSVPYAGRSRLTPDEQTRLSPVIWVLGIGGTTLVAVAQVVNGLGWVHSPSAAPLYWGVLWMILFGAIQFYRNLFGPR